MLATGRGTLYLPFRLAANASGTNKRRIEKMSEVPIDISKDEWQTTRLYPLGAKRKPGRPDRRYETRNLSAELAGRRPRAPAPTSGADAKAPIATACMVCCRSGMISGMAAAPIRVQAWGRAVGWVRRASPICEDRVAYICRSRLHFLSSPRKRLERP